MLNCTSTISDWTVVPTKLWIYSRFCALDTSPICRKGIVIWLEIGWQINYWNHCTCANKQTCNFIKNDVNVKTFHKIPKEINVHVYFIQDVWRHRLHVYLKTCRHWRIILCAVRLSVQVNTSFKSVAFASRFPDPREAFHCNFLSYMLWYFVCLYMYMNTRPTHALELHVYFWCIGCM